MDLGIVNAYKQVASYQLNICDWICNQFTQELKFILKPNINYTHSCTIQKYQIHG